jgi:hypothetical protein
MTSPAPFTVTGVLLQAKPAWPHVVAKTGTTNNGSSFSVYNAADAQILRVGSDGNVGIGLTMPMNWSSILTPTIEHTDTSISFGDDTDIHFTSNAYYPVGGPWSYKSTDPAANYYLWKGAHYWRVAPAGTVGTALPWSTAMKLNNAGNLGIGTENPQTRLHVVGQEVLIENRPPAPTGANTVLGLASRAAGGGVYSWKFFTGTENNPGATPANGFDLFEYPGSTDPAMLCCIHRFSIRPKSPTAPSVPPKLIVIGDTGNFGIGVWTPQQALHVAGNGQIDGDLIVSGNVAARYQDVAEWVPASGDLTPGTVVVLRRDQVNEVTASTNAYDTAVAGVVSSQPGVILGEAGATKEMIATTGRVRVRVDASKAAVAIGDLLVSGDTPGTAMKSEPMEINGRKFHQPGTIIGKALEPLAGGTGEILVLLSLQ